MTTTSHHMALHLMVTTTRILLMVTTTTSHLMALHLMVTTIRNLRTVLTKRILHMAMTTTTTRRLMALPHTEMTTMAHMDQTDHLLTATVVMIMTILHTLEVTTKALMVALPEITTDIS
jgi:hypothetical protein